jgi:hypothetical protein
VPNRSGILFLWAALAATVALIAGSCSSGRHRASPPTVPTTLSRTAATTTSTTLPLAVSPYTWSRVVSPVLDQGGGPTSTLASVLPPSAGQPWVIAGTQTDNQGEPTATVWTSINGSAWSEVTLPSAGVPSEAGSAAEYRNETIVVGSVGSDASRRAAVWAWSEPDGTWKLVAVEPSAGSSYMFSAAAGALGFFAAGKVGSHQALWSSADGTNWTEATGAERAISSIPSGRVNSLLVGGTAVYAAGSARSGPVTTAALWSSGDGINWHPVVPAPDSFAGSGDRVITSLAPLGTGLVAVGAVASGSSWLPASWISPNGVSWSQPSLRFPSPGYGAGSVVQAVTSETTPAGASDLYAVGGSSQGQSLWESTNGLNWTPVALPPAAADATAWEATLVATHQGTTIVADGDPGQPHVLTSVGGQWSQPSAVPTTFGSVQPFAFPLAVESGEGRVSVEVEVETPSQTVGGYNLSTAVITSAYTDTNDAATTQTNLQSWTAGTPADMTGTPPQLPETGAIATRFLGDWVAVAPGDSSTSTEGSASTGAAQSWTSADGVTWGAGGLLVNSVAGGAGTSSPAGSTASTTTTTTAATTIKKAVPSGLCENSSATPFVEAVGSTASSATASGALAWGSSTGLSWQPAQVQPPPSPSGVEKMVGCVAYGADLLAYGTSTVPAAGPEPALWRSSGGRVWSRQPLSGFGAGAPYPVDSLALHGSTWLATAGLPTSPGPTVPSDPGMVTPGWGGPGTYQGSGSEAGSLLISSNGGVTWAAVPTAGSPWSGEELTELTSVVFAGATPLVFGSVDGRLTVWVGLVGAAS